jgi:GNAT superfamily N-acetyltransferase
MFPEAHRLLRREFSREEMLPMQDWRDAMKERAEGLWTDINWHLIIAERDGELLGAASGSYLGNVNVGIVGYLAVRADGRGLGLGPRLRRHLQRAFEQDARRILGRPLDAIVGEVRVDNPWLRTLVRRDGAIALDFEYHQPALGRGRDAVPLVLYYQPLAKPRRAIPAAELKRLLYTMWRRPYRIGRPLSRATFRKMLKGLEGRTRIGQRKLRDTERG